MEKKRLIGTSILGVLLVGIPLAFFLLTLLISNLNFFPLSRQEAVNMLNILWTSPFGAILLIQLILGLELLHLEAWAHGWLIGLSVVYIFFGAGLFFVSNGEFASSSELITCVVFPILFGISVIFYLTRPKVKAQFTESREV